MYLPVLSACDCVGLDMSGDNVFFYFDLFSFWLFSSWLVRWIRLLSILLGSPEFAHERACGEVELWLGRIQDTGKIQGRHKAVMGTRHLPLWAAAMSWRGAVSAWATAREIWRPKWEVKTLSKNSGYLTAFIHSVSGLELPPDFLQAQNVPLS